MRGTRGQGGKGGDHRRFLRAPLFVVAGMIAAAAVVPTVVNAFADGAGAARALPVSLAARGGLGSFTPADVDPRLVARVSLHALADGKLFRFTPAGSGTHADRAVTVAVRLPELRARMIGVRPGTVSGNPGLAAVRIAPTAFSLGVSRGYQSFASITATLPHEPLHDNQELRSFSLARLAPVSKPSTASGSFSRIEPRIAFDLHETAGRSPRTLESQGTYQVDLGGSYRVTGNLDVTAGVRYSSDRDRLRPLTDHRQDAQAIYVGTQFRF